MLHDAEKILSLGFLPGDLRSHPDKKLVVHLNGVADISQRLAEIYELPVNRELLRQLAITHDLGKAHPDFQTYLDKKGPGINHAEPSGWFTYLLTRDLWAAEAVRRHHTSLRDVDDLEYDWLPDGTNEEKIKNRLHRFLPEWPVPLTKKVWQELEDLLIDGPNVSIDVWLHLRLLYSVLIAADRMEALGIEVFSYVNMPAFSPLSFNDYTKLGQWREKTRQMCIKQAEQIEKPGVYTLTLPTGAGKTLLGLEIARKWSNKFKCRSIIYALPFISVVEQNAAVAKRVFGETVQEDHSLAYAGGQESDADNDSDACWQRMLSLFRYWREPVVVTTMVQLWEALFNTKANKTMNFHKLSRAVVILDEPQSISPNYWGGLSDTLNYLSEKLGTTFLFMTATQPHIKAAAELAPRDLSRPFERHRYLVKGKKYEFDQLSDLLCEHLPVAQESGLVVLNTKRAALKGYKKLKDIVADAPVLFLSGWMTPCHRKKVLAQLHQLEQQNIRRYLVSTQVVEAGVDLDFDWVFRDIGPLDSIVQVAGRCNRHLKKLQPGRVLVAELTEKNRTIAQSVYDPILLLAASEILPRDCEFGENEVIHLIDTYYTKVLDALRCVPIYQNLSEGKWNQIPPLIEKRSEKEVDVIIEQNEKVRDILEQLQNRHWSLEERHEQKQLFQELQQYMISIPEKYIPACRSAVAKITTQDTWEPFGKVFGGHAYFMTKDGMNAGLYDEVLGFVPPIGAISGGVIID
ncbi:CRISPR-associated helicase Cas3' [Desulforamulus putei]|uniref:CRISPR-associated helicase Cas3' n=1 Tax=Desulforamulus putei TaxID=74701 RepID=UPI002FDC9578